MTEFSIQKEIQIEVPRPIVWKCLVTPEIIAKYMYGTQTITDWKVGSEIIFQGSYEGQEYKDKGVIRACDQDSTLSYTYFSFFSGLEDRPENYHLVTLNLQDHENECVLTLTQENIHSA